MVFLATLLYTVVSQGYTAFWQTQIRLPITFSQNVIDPKNTGGKDLQALRLANYPKLVQDALVKRLGIDPNNRADVALATQLVSQGVRTQLGSMVMEDLSVIGTTQDVWLYANSTVDSALKGQFDTSIPEERRPIKDKQLAWMAQLEQAGDLEQRFNTGFFTFGASSRAETAGVGVAIIGSLYMMLLVLALALPIGVAASIYLEEFAPKNRFTDFIEVNINNLAAVPSIVYAFSGSPSSSTTWACPVRPRWSAAWS